MPMVDIAMPLDFVHLIFFRNERNFRALRLKTDQVDVKRAWHESQLANVNQRDDPT